MKKKMDLVPPIVKELAKHEKEASLFKDKLKEILNIPLPLNMIQTYEEHGISLSSVDARILDGMTAAITIKALQGDIGAYTTIRDTMGYKPVDKVQSDMVVRIEMSNQARELGE